MPLPLGISNNLLWRGYGYFLELHNVHIKSIFGRIKGEVLGEVKKKLTQNRFVKPCTPSPSPTEKWVKLFIK